MHATEVEINLIKGYEQKRWVRKRETDWVPAMQSIILQAGHELSDKYSEHLR